MASLVKVRTRRGRKVYVIDFLYPAADGTTQRYRKDARAPTKAAADQEALRLFTGAMQTGRIPGEASKEPASREERGWTFAEAVTFWQAQNARKHSTRHGYGVNFEAHLLPRFRSKRLHTFSHADVTRLRSELKDLSISTVNNVEIALRAVLRFAKVNGHLDLFPEFPPLRVVPQRVITPPRPEDVVLVIGAAYPTARLAMALAAYGGLRSGEIRGLRCKDVDLDRGIIVVRRSIYRGVADTPKSGHDRQIPIAAPLAPLLAAALDRKHRPTDPVSITNRGEAWGEGSLRSAFQRVLARAELPAARMHDLRHFFVTECFRAGAPAPDVQRLAGHLHLHVTQRYAHTNEESQRDAMAAFSARMVSKSAAGVASSKPPETDGPEDAEATVD